MAATMMEEAKGAPRIAQVKCDCCGLMEECTSAYIARVKERHQGHWICGLCDEGIKDEKLRSEKEPSISNEEALNRHTKFRQQFKSLPSHPTEELISPVKQLLFRSLDSPRRENKGRNRPEFGRFQSCLASVSE